MTYSRPAAALCAALVMGLTSGVAVDGLLYADDNYATTEGS